MAVDTRNKRASIGGFLFRRAPTPDGTIDAADRRHVSGWYAGIAAAAASAIAQVSFSDFTMVKPVSHSTLALIKPVSFSNIASQAEANFSNIELLP